MFPAIIEAFHNHGGAQLKCYAIAGQCFVHVKASFPDVASDVASSGAVCKVGDQQCRCTPAFVLPFHSLDAMPQASMTVVAHSPLQDCDRSAVEDCARVIAAATGLSLFGFDLIRPQEEGSQEWLLIDVNAFPSFKGVPEVASHLRQMLRQVAALQSATTCKHG